MHYRARASGASDVRFDRPTRQAIEPRAKREAMSALCHGLVVDSTFERSENVAITYTVSYTLACSEWCGLHLRMRIVIVFSHIIPWLWHQTYLYNINYIQELITQILYLEMTPRFPISVLGTVEQLQVLFGLWTILCTTLQMIVITIHSISV